MKILLTGGAGYVGSHVAKVLLEFGHGVAVLDNLATGHMRTISKLAELGKRNFSFFEADICATDHLEQIFRQYEPDAIVHMAGLKLVEESFERPEAYFRCNVVGTASLLSAASACRCKRVIYSSTAAVYGASERCPFREDLPPSPSSPYGWTKALAERLVRKWGETGYQARTAIVLRYFNPCGHDRFFDNPLQIEDSGGNSLADAMVRVATGLESHLEIYGNTYPTADGTCRRDFVHIRDIAEAHLRAVAFTETAAPSFDIFNLGSGKDTSVLEFLEAFHEATGLRVPFSFVPPRKGDLAVSRADVERAAMRMKWVPRYDIHGICQAIRPRGHSVRPAPFATPPRTLVRRNHRERVKG
ncbi:UDP-glucose 4-epimerase GalE [Nitratireductor sp. CAU 1489]|uniref:UDP-glucose 4-epimerase n=1 Tax=Nitratireductor arenosus TaxID=2682096 RepID=A0A844Q8Y8_9HYPH|nr:UDP-glucose 4-epimerase GalE [Nitratireductor arenosus]MVA96556.1 UDP-glucose 4-epimerase GalE [Nitratireductor arenosus]